MEPAALMLDFLLVLAALIVWVLVIHRVRKARLRLPGREPPRVRPVHAKLERWEHPMVRWNIFERDGWRCHLCGGEVTTGVTDPESQAQIDHVLPQARGGGHHDENLKTACRRCNLLKGDFEDNQAVRRAIRAWRAWTDPNVLWVSAMQPDLDLYRRLATRPGFRGQMRKVRWSDRFVV